MLCRMRLPEVVENVGAHAAVIVKNLRDHRSWPAWVEVACALVMGEKDLLARVKFLCHTYARWERKG